MRFFALVLAVVPTILATGGCRRLDAPPPPAFKFVVRVESDPKRPLAGARVFYADKELGLTDASGVATVTLKGNEGDSVQLSVKCVETHQSPGPFNVTLRRLADPTRIAEQLVQCPPLVRRVVVGVRADNGPNLPVMFLGNVVARTDMSGAAHFALDVKPGEQFEVLLKTEDQPRLLPKNPARSFVVRPMDDVVVFNQTFGFEKKKPSPPRGPGPRGPRPVGGPSKF